MLLKGRHLDKTSRRHHGKGAKAAAGKSNNSSIQFEKPDFICVKWLGQNIRNNGSYAQRQDSPDVNILFFLNNQKIELLIVFKFN